MPRPRAARLAAFDVAGVVALVAVAAAWCVVLSTAYGGENRCDMSYMYPSFFPVTNVALASPAHALYRYRDARARDDDVDDRARASGDASACVVINVFVPGTGGGYGQARSAASGTLESEGCRVEHYALDFAEELSAYNGMLLARQAKSVARALDGLRTLERARTERRVVAGWSVVGHSAGGLAAMEAAASALGSELGLTIVNLATPSAWNPVSLTLTQRAREAGVRRRWRTSDARRSVALVSVVGGERDRQVSSSPMGFVDDWVEEGLGVSASASTASRVGVSADHRCAAWCKQLIVAISRGFAEAFPRSKVLTAHQRARAFRDALGDKDAARAPSPTFGVPARAYEATQERTPSALAGVVANVLAPRSVMSAFAFALIAHAASPSILRERVVESVIASLAVYVASGWIANRAFDVRGDVRRALTTCMVLAHVPSLIAWAHHVLRTLPTYGFHALVPPFGAMDAVALCFAAASTRFGAIARDQSSGASRARQVAWCLAAGAAAPGNVGLIHIAGAVVHCAETLRLPRASLPKKVA
ncbi:predicted protein [Ostreococcus lucimarinus CCE9901]|jgi:hypothetical protein|uniref:GPI inositol-deacylase n=1 Tax=Ostreococcus lucimarinus (strain CCE9901) TaxID=436017 RepID=A4SAN6_OSTLU|nr:predicted protein [Ostreococcus lucimarinus CCE9901]ABP00782.1 predicted protein [Ostreococcus lucimarinus CCE9901]|eukprot:XP_001422465.1 predicted protein [Ostreococcus lucimarinus CCE9901]